MREREREYRPRHRRRFVAWLQSWGLAVPPAPYVPKHRGEEEA